MLNIDHLTFSYGNRIVIDDLSACWEKGKIHGIVGLNGAGKTTLFNILSGCLKPNRGDIVFNNRCLTINDIAFLETDNYFFPLLTAREYLYVFKQTNKNYNEQALINLFKLPYEKLAEEYSSGMKKKLAMIALLKQDKELYLLDEPFNGLDVEGVLLFEEILLQLKSRGKTILVSSHILESLTKLSDTISLLDKGVIESVFSLGNYLELHEKLDNMIKSGIQNHYF